MGERMAFWSKWFSRTEKDEPEVVSPTPEAPALPPPPPPPPPTPQRVELVPGGPHALVSVREGVCSARSEGLVAVGHPDVILDVLLRRGEDPDELLGELVKMLRTIHHLATQGHAVTAGGRSLLGPGGFLEPTIAGLIYAHEATDLLRGFLVRRDEVALLESTSTFRVLSRIGQLSGTFPFPTDSNRDRPSVARDGDEGSLLAKVSKAVTPGISAILTDRTLRITARPSVQELLANLMGQLNPKQVVALITPPDPAASGHLVWFPGQEAPSAITPPGGGGERLAGGFLLLVPLQDHDSVRLDEDGFTVFLTRATWAKLRTALAGGKPLSFSGGADGIGLSLTWLPEAYLNPVDGQTYHTSDGWQNHSPKQGGVRDGERIVLLSGDPQLVESGVSIDDLTAVIREMLVLARQEHGQDPPARLYIQANLRPDGPPEWSGWRTDEQPISGETLAALAALSAPEVASLIAFQVVIERT
ncbi:MAG: hypothetical protein ACI8RZ_000521 [Myxococcota bacterium]|jgi:hypothetical protein